MDIEFLIKLSFSLEYIIRLFGKRKGSRVGWGKRGKKSYTTVLCKQKAETRVHLRTYVLPMHEKSRYIQMEDVSETPLPLHRSLAF